MKTKNLLSTLLFLVLITSSFAQHHDLKLNFGFAAAKPLYDLGEVAGKGHDLQPHLSLEGKIIKLPYGKDSKLGLKVSGVAGIEWANFLSNDAITELNVVMPHLKARVYPFSYNGFIMGDDDDFFDNQEFVEKMPFPIDLLFLFGEVLAVNSLHFDYGVSFATIEETAFIDYYEFTPETVNRTMTYTGWGLQPQIYQSESGKWTWNGFFDFGKYKWENANGGTSGMKVSNLGFGVQRNF